MFETISLKKDPTPKHYLSMFWREAASCAELLQHFVPYISIVLAHGTHLCWCKPIWQTITNCSFTVIALKYSCNLLSQPSRANSPPSNRQHRCGWKLNNVEDKMKFPWKISGWAAQWWNKKNHPFSIYFCPLSYYT